MLAREQTLSFEDTVNIQFTSGTTGYPKGVTLTHHGILNNALYVGEALECTPEDRLAINVPLYHTIGMVLGNLVALQYGSTMVYPAGSYEPKATLEAVTKEKCTAFYGVPTMFTAALKELDNSSPGQYDMSSLRTGLIAGSVCPAPLMQACFDRMNMHGLCIMYGMTELSPVATLMGPDDPFEKRISTIGRVAPMAELKIIDEQGTIVPVGEKGEICVRGYLVMKGYWDDEEKTAEAVDDAGWMHSGDLGEIDEDGFVQIVGRVKDLIIRGGENISPKEIEEVIGAHSLVRDV